MKVLFVASNPEEADGLALEKEITELQKRSLNAGIGQVNFVFLPDISIEQLAFEIGRTRPDILHLSSHADDKMLTMKNEAGKGVKLSSKFLLSLLDVDSPPRLVYLNACNSGKIAEEISSVVQVAIGTTAPITNRTARAAAVRFYERLVEGASVLRAYEGSAVLMAVLSENSAQSRIYPRSGFYPANMFFHEVPRIVAKFRHAKDGKAQFYTFDIGLVGCPATTIQAIMYTTDPSFLEGEDLEPQLSLTTLTLERPTKGELWWGENKEGWDGIEGDFSLYACGVTSDGQQFVASSTLCDALTLFYTLQARRSDVPTNSRRAPPLPTIPLYIRRKIDQLQRNDGAVIAPLVIGPMASPVPTTGTRRKKRCLKPDSRKTAPLRR